MKPLRDMNRVAYWSIISGSALAALYFLMWAIQTSWLGSFPGRDVELYTRWTYMQLGASLLAVIIGAVVAVKGRRKRASS